MSEFKDLITELTGDLETMAKAKAPDCDDDKEGDKRVAAAAADGDKMSAKENPRSDKKSDKDDETFGKSFEVVLEDGTKVEAYDGSVMLKALQTESGELRENVDDLRKAFEMAVSVMKQMREEAQQSNELLKALQGKIADVGASPTGRRSMIAIAEKLSAGSQTSTAAVDAKPTGGAVMMKAKQMCTEGSLGWEALPRIEAFQARGALAPPDLLARFPQLLTPVS